MHTIGNLVGVGGCADVIMLDEGRVLKAFRRIQHSDHLLIDWADHEAITRAKFRAEAHAYRDLAALPDLNPYVPKYFGVVDPMGLSCLRDTSKYVAGCGLILEFISGSAKKLAYLDTSIRPDVEVIVERLEETLGLEHASDGSCFVPGKNGAPFTLIDFAYWDAGEYEMALGSRRALTVDERKRLERENAD